MRGRMCGSRCWAPVQMTLAGVAFGAVFGGIASGLSLKNPQALDRMRFWGAGSISGRSWDVVAAIAPLLLIGCCWRVRPQGR